MTEALALARRWVVDYFNRQDSAAARAFCAPDYTLCIGDVVLAGRDDAWECWTKHYNDQLAHS